MIFFGLGCVNRIVLPTKPWDSIQHDTNTLTTRKQDSSWPAIACPGRKAHDGFDDTTEWHDLIREPREPFS